MDIDAVSSGSFRVLTPAKLFMHCKRLIKPGSIAVKVVLQLMMPKPQVSNTDNSSINLGPKDDIVGWLNPYVRKIKSSILPEIAIEKISSFLKHGKTLNFVTYL